MATNGNGVMGRKIASPMDMLENLLAHGVHIKCRNGRELRGVLHAYDEHLNVVVSGVEETNNVPGQVAQTRHMDMLYVRGDAVTMITKVGI
ncbi:unnamed protein product [Amoebophrya sp. A25]|nr:unnamed protein product [Amoebophrya sp. A25]|eukprot:GSA25T00020303001.1